MATPSEIVAAAMRTALSENVDWNKVSLESFGYFLDNYIISGGEISFIGKNVTISAADISLNTVLYHVKATTIPISAVSQTLYIDFVPALGIVAGKDHPTVPYQTFHTVTTDSSGNVVSSTDQRGTVGGLRFRPEFGTGLGGSSYIHDQISAQATWTITHNLGKHPSVTIVDSAGNVVVGDVLYNDFNTLTVSFSASFSGKAYLN